jgi:hypothetical protein
MPDSNQTKTHIRAKAGKTSRNGLVPSGSSFRYAQHGLSNWLQWGSKCVFSQGIWLRYGETPYSSNSQQDDQWAFHFHSGYGSTRLRIFTVVTSDGASTSGTPQFQWREDGGSLLGEIRYVADVTTTDVDPGEFRYFIDYIDISENTTYKFRCRTDNNVRIVAVGAHLNPNRNAESDSTLGQPSTVFGDSGPILDADIAGQQALAEGLWKRNSSGLFTWSAANEDTAGSHDTRIACTNSTYENLFDQGTTSYAGTIATKVNTYRLGTDTKRKVPCRLAVLAKVSDVAATGNVKLIDSSGDITGSELSFTSTSYTWQTADIELDDQSGGHTIEWFGKVTATYTMDVLAISLYQYL